MAKIMLIPERKIYAHYANGFKLAMFNYELTDSQKL